jgi:rod shape-determining protein MreC
VVSADLSSQRQRLVIDQGDRAGLYRSQAIVDATGLVGQLVRVGPFSAEVMLISDPGHAVPVEILRNGVRTVAEGTGNEDELRLSLLPATADVKAGDSIVTSGLGGVFPAGIPVGPGGRCATRTTSSRVSASSRAPRWRGIARSWPCGSTPRIRRRR